MNRETIFAKVTVMIERHGGRVRFDTPIIVKKTPHIHLISIYDVMIEGNEMGVCDADGKWHELNASQINADYLINSLYQRLRLMESPVHA